METIEGNKLIAEFMEAKPSKGDDWCDCMDFTANGVLQRRVRVENLKYHSSWDWLMPVVQKIKSWYDEESDNYVHALVESDEVGIFDLKITAPIKYVWNFTVQFIQWLNKQPK